MGSKGISRELKLRINQLAHERTHRTPFQSSAGYRNAYQEEKARLLAQVVTRLASGKTLNEIFAELPTVRKNRYSKILATYNAMRKAIMEMP